MYKQIIKRHRVNVITFFCVIYSIIPASAQVAPPKEYPGTFIVNYVRNWSSRIPESDPVILKTKPAKDVTQSTSYFDGLGRPLQTVIKQGSLETVSGTLTDMINPLVYDDMWREQFKYLPFVANNTAGNNSITDGNMKLNPFQQQAVFFSDPNGVLKEQGETYYYCKTDFEASPLSRVEKTMSPGNSWVGSNRGLEGKYWFNTSVDDVKKWRVTDVSNSWGTFDMTGVYSDNELYKNVAADEHGKQVIEFTDKEGKIILRKVQLTAAADAGTGRDYTGWLCTYYIYDDLNNLRCVVQPEGVKTLVGPWSLTTTLLNEQCFRYEYDERNRLVMKKVPGAGEVWMVYDSRDRLVLSQDANLRVQGKWMYTLYENDFNRLSSTGLWTNANDRVYHKGQASTSTAYPNLSGQTFEELTVTFYDSYTWLSSYVNPLPSVYNNSYDTYFQPASNVNWPYPQANTQSSLLKGMVTGSRVKILGSSTYLYMVSFYDERGRMIQTQRTNITGGVDIVTTQYTWGGQPLIIIQKQVKQGGNTQTSVVVSQMTYDELGRLLKTEKKVSNTLVNGNGMPAYKTILENQYDKLGQLKSKKLAPAYNSSAGLETLNFDYNIRGWMLGMNRDFAKDLNSTNWFGFDLGYDKADNNIIGNQTYSNPQYNGNIEGMVWKSKSDAEKRKYDFGYDAVNRILKADFTQYNGSAFNTSAGVDFSIKIGDGVNVATAYDANGNILQMQQWGLKLTGSSQVDNMRYTYVSGSNKLKSVTDFNNDIQTKLGDFKTNVTHPQAATKSGLTPSSSQSQFDAITDYTYDVNGNLNLDNNKAISSITYNHLNLPLVITVTGKGTITYTYDAAGNKLKKLTSDITTAGKTIFTTTSYINGFIYESKQTTPANTPNDDYADKLQFAGQEEGRIRALYDNPATPATITGFAYDYFIKDHLGNIRIVLTEEQKTNMYPAATMEDVSDPGDLGDPNNYIPYYSKTDYTQNSDWRYPVNQISNYPSDDFTGEYVTKLLAEQRRIGPGIALKVMAEDKVHIRVKSWWVTGGASSPGNNPNQIFGDLVNAISGSVGNLSGISHSEITNILSDPMTVGLSGSIGNFITNQDNNSDGNIPRAFVTWILLDQQFKIVASSSGFEQVGADGELAEHVFEDLLIEKSGYLYVYVSNEAANIPVFFDNLQVTHIRGPLLEETHYYPFGLTMSGISSKALAFGNPQNRYKFNKGTELNSDFDLSFYETECRLYDPQVGRFCQVDELAEANWEWSTYEFAHNNPISLNDPLGLFSEKPKETSTPDKPKELSKVVVVAIPKGHWAKQRLYYDVMDQLNRRGATIDQLLQPSLREMMYRYDAITKLRQEVADGMRGFSNFLLEAGSFFIPTSWLLKAKYLKYAKRLFNWKRGKTVSTLTEKTVVAAGEQAIQKTGTTVLGKIGEFEKLAEKLGANSFKVEKYTWEANQKFLDEAITRGDNFVFSSTYKEATKSFAKEINYLLNDAKILDKGYKIAEDGMSFYK